MNTNFYTGLYSIVNWWSDSVTWPTTTTHTHWNAVHFIIIIIGKSFETLLWATQRYKHDYFHDNIINARTQDIDFG